MELTQLYTWMSLLLSIIICKLSQCNAKPTYYDLDSYENSYDHGYDRTYDRSGYDSGNSYTLTYGKPLTSDLDKLDTGYYYVDNGYIAPVPSRPSGVPTSQRRQNEYNDGIPEGYRVSPIVSYRSTHTKKKKLFVPNFFG